MKSKRNKKRKIQVVNQNNEINKDSQEKNKDDTSNVIHQKNLKIENEPCQCQSPIKLSSSSTNKDLFTNLKRCANCVSQLNVPISSLLKKHQQFQEQFTHFLNQNETPLENDNIIDQMKSTQQIMHNILQEIVEKQKTIYSKCQANFELDLKTNETDQ